MSKELIAIIILGVTLLLTLIGLIVSLCRGEMKNFVKEKMGEAEAKFPKTMKDYKKLRLNYVIDAFNKKYKILEFLLNVRKFIEEMIEFSKSVNYKK